MRVSPLAFFAVLCLHAAAQEPAGTLLTPTAVAVDTWLHRAYAVDAPRDRLLMYDERTQQQTEIAVGHSPIAVAVDAEAHRVYVVNAESGTVSVLDARTNAVLATVAADRHPYAIAVDARMHRAFVSNTYSNKLTIVNGIALTSEQKALGSKDAIAVDAQHGEAFLIGYEDPNIMVITREGAVVRRLEARIHLWGIADDAAHHVVYATAIGDRALEVMEVATGERHEVPVGNFPCAVVLRADGSRAYVVNREDGTVSVVDTASRHVVATVPVGRQPQGIALDEAHHRAVVANAANGTVSIIDTRTDRVVRTVRAGAHPYAVAVDAESSGIFVVSTDAPVLHRVR